MADSNQGRGGGDFQCIAGSDSSMADSNGKVRTLKQVNFIRSDSSMADSNGG